MNETSLRRNGFRKHGNYWYVVRTFPRKNAGAITEMLCYYPASKVLKVKRLTKHDPKTPAS